jgi:hypothetical protein
MVCHYGRRKSMDAHRLGFLHPRRRLAFWRHGGSVVLALAMMCQSGWAKPNVSDWKNVEALDSGSAIWVRTMAGKKLHGELVRVTDEMLWLYSDEPGFPGRRSIQREIPREKVKEIRRFSQAASIAVGTAIGIGVGVGIGAVIDARAPVPDDDPHLATFIFGLLGGLFGSAVSSCSTLIKGKTIYKAP